MQLSHVTHS